MAVFALPDESASRTTIKIKCKCKRIDGVKKCGWYNRGLGGLVAEASLADFTCRSRDVTTDAVTTTQVTTNAVTTPVTTTTPDTDLMITTN